MTNHSEPVLVLGATGKTGSRVLQKLTNLAVKVRSGSRSATPKFDWTDPSSWSEALDGVKRIYLSFQPDLAAPGADECIKSFVAMAADHGVEKIVLLSGRGEVEAERCEHIVIDSGLAWTIVRASWFNQNFSEGYLLDSILAGYVSLPASDVKEPFIDAEDIADVAVAAITQPGHENKIYEVTGPRLLSFKEAVAEISESCGRDIVYTQTPVADYTAQLNEYEVPQEYIALLSYLFSEILDGRNESVANGVEDALGRPARDFADFTKSVAASGVWDVPNHKVS